MNLGSIKNLIRRLASKVDDPELSNRARLMVEGLNEVGGDAHYVFALSQAEISNLRRVVLWSLSDDERAALAVNNGTIPARPQGPEPQIACVRRAIDKLGAATRARRLGRPTVPDPSPAVQ